MLVGQRIYPARPDHRRLAARLRGHDRPASRRAYARLHPEDVRLAAAARRTSDDPLWRATTTIELAELHGPFLSYTLHADVERDDAAALAHEPPRGDRSLDRAARPRWRASSAATSHRIARRRTEVAAATLDSVRAGGGPGRPRAHGVAPPLLSARSRGASRSPRRRPAGRRLRAQRPRRGRRGAPARS